MRNFKLPNVLTRHGVRSAANVPCLGPIEGDYVVEDMEYAGPDCTGFVS